MSVIIVGAGVIGLLSALNLSQYVDEVVLIERHETGREASWAGGGIVSPLYPWRYNPEVTALAHWSQDFYPALGQYLIDLAKIDPQVYVTGLYWLDLEDEAQALTWAKVAERPLYSQPIELVYKNVPPLGPGFKRALYMRGVANVRNPRLVKALRAALKAKGNVRIIEHCLVEQVLSKHGHVQGVQTEQGVLHSDQVVITAGAWSGKLLESLGLKLPVEPVKGQMILYKCSENFLTSMIMAKGRYAIPRKDGHILIGSTLEHAGFDKAPTDEALRSLKASAVELLPALASAEVVNHWAGLRPGSPNGVPFIGPAPHMKGLWLNCGHYRNGLVLAPASCRLLTDLMTGQRPIIDPAPYLPEARL
ncbi:glycine oxidase ThiO [Pseudomonas luteola]|uniref:Glycine oxidase ThiO n=1 Tax=Pseudomonas luteola TaxID=47886 RepID=A0ABS0MQE1_PSELU|nr:glycine oxidase ThiO [Pseudomonas luteola]